LAGCAGWLWGRQRGRSSRSLRPLRTPLFSLPKNLSERGQQQRHVPAIRSVTHQADSPSFALERAEASADLDAVVVEQNAARLRIVQAVGNLHRVKHWEMPPFLAHVADADVVQPGAQEFVHLAMAIPAIF